MLRQRRRPAAALQPADPACRGRVLVAHQQHQSWTGNDRHDPARHHLVGAIFSDRRRGDHSRYPCDRTRSRRPRAAAFLSRRRLPEEFREADLTMVTVMRETILAASAAVLMASASIEPAQAHALLDHASPALGSAVPTAPATVAIWYTQDLEPAFSSLTVTNQAGQRVDLGNAQIAPAQPNELQVGLKPLPPGT